MAHFLVEVAFKGAADPDSLLAQRGFLDRITAEGSLFLAAMLPEHPGKGIAILEAATIDDAKALYAQAPLAEKGILDWSVQALTLTYGTAVGAAS